jgi:transcription elongation factor Elf1
MVIDTTRITQSYPKWFSRTGSSAGDRYSRLMPLVTCPHCEEDENLEGKTVDGVITITCGECGAMWDRDFTPKCLRCGSTEVRDALQAILDKSRGTQLSIQSLRVVWLCPDCDTDKLRSYLDSNVPLPPDELPVNIDN